MWVGKRDITHTTNNEQQQTVVVKYTVVSMKKGCTGNTHMVGERKTTGKKSDIIEHESWTNMLKPFCGAY